MASETSQLPRILSIPRSDEADAHVLLHLSPSGPDPLDMRIVATEGENPYVGSVKKSRLKNLRAKNYQGSDEEWAQIVSYVLATAPAALYHSAAISGVTVSAVVSGAEDENKEVTISIRKKIEAITQRLGFIILKQDDEQAIELFEWSYLAVARADALQGQVSSLTDRYRAAENTIQKLNAQLEELLDAKNQHEAQLMHHFVQLLNEKKLKIRNQQRLLAASTADPAKVAEIKAATSGRSRRRTTKTDTPKRKAEEFNEDESENGFEDMDVDRPAVESEQETEDEQPSTPQPLEEEEDTAASDENPDQPPPAIVDAGRSVAETADTEKRTMSKNSPPPRRELPFSRNKYQKRKEEKIEPGAAGSAGESDDDEL